MTPFRKNLASGSGFTLLELLLSMAMGIIVISGIYATYVFFSNTFNTQEEIVEMQQTSEWLERDIIEYMKMAGGGLAGDLQGARTFDSSENRIIFVGNIHGKVARVAVAAVSGASRVKVSDARGFRVKSFAGFHDLATRKTSQHAVTAVDTAARTVDFSPALTRPLAPQDEASPYDSVEFVRDGSLRLLRRISGNNAQVVAENVEKLRFTFVNGVGIEKNGPVSWRDVSGVKYAITIRSARSDKNYLNESYGDHYRRRVKSGLIARRSR